MNFGEMKTTVFARIPKEKRELVSIFEFGEAIDAAQRLFAAVLPGGSIPDVLIENFIDRRLDLGATKVLPLPEDYLRVESVHFAQAREDETDLPLRKPARIVGAATFEELVHSGTTEQLASVYNNLLHLHPEPAAAVEGAPAAIKMVYRKIPRPYVTTAGIIQAGARMHLRQDPDSRRTFKCIEHGGNTAKPFSHWGLGMELVPGGYAYIGAPYMTADQKGPLYVCRIVMAWEVDNLGDLEAHIRVSSDDSIPFEDESPGVGFLFPYCYVTHRPVFGYSGNAVEAEDWEFPEIGSAWHNMVCDYAIARLETSWNPQGAIARENRVLAALSAAGAKLEYAKDAK